MRRVVVVGHGMVGSRFVEELVAADPTVVVTVLGRSRSRRTTGCCCRAWWPVRSDPRCSASPAPPHPRVEVLTGVAAVDIDRSRRVVLDDRGSRHPYDELVLATGSAARVRPGRAGKLSLAVPRGLRSTRCFACRKTGDENDWVVRYDNRFFQLTRQSPLSAGAQHRARLRGRGRASGDPVSRSAHGVAGNRHAAACQDRPAAAGRPAAVRAAATHAPADHPWRQGFKRWAATYRTGNWSIDEEPVEAAGAVDAQNAPTLLGKLQNSFPRAPTGVLGFSFKGDILRGKNGDISIALTAA